MNPIEIALFVVALAYLYGEWRHAYQAKVQRQRAEELVAKPIRIYVRCGEDLVEYLRADAVKEVMDQMLNEACTATAVAARNRMIQHLKERGFTLAPSSAVRSTVEPSAKADPKV